MTQYLEGHLIFVLYHFCQYDDTNVIAE